MLRYIGSENSSFPYSAMAYIVATFSDGTRASGSGTLVGRNDVLTQAQVIYDPILGVATGVQIELWCDGGSRPYGKYESVDLNSASISLQQ